MLCVSSMVLGLLSACGEGLSDKQLQKANLAASAASDAVSEHEVMAPQPLTASAPVIEVHEVASEPVVTAPEARTSSVIHEFNPADFPDACNDYIDTVSQCIDVMNKQGMEGTGSMQMQLDEMQASWLKETDKDNLNRTCSEAITTVEPMLHDLGC